MYKIFRIATLIMGERRYLKPGIYVGVDSWTVHRDKAETFAEFDNRIWNVMRKRYPDQEFEMDFDPEPTFD